MSVVSDLLQAIRKIVLLEDLLRQSLADQHSMREDLMPERRLLSSNSTMRISRVPDDAGYWLAGIRLQVEIIED